MARCILVVDDEPDLLELVRFNLDRAGFKVETAVSGEEALARLRRSTPDLLVQRFRFSRTYFQRGASPKGMRTFGLVDAAGHEVSMFGESLGDSDLALFRQNGEFDSVSQPGFGCIAISIADECLEGAFEASETVPECSGPLGGANLLGTAPAALARLRQRAIAILQRLEARACDRACSEILEELTFELPAELVSAIHSANGRARRSPSRVRDLALRRALSLIDERMQDPPTVRMLCQEVGVGWTTLVQAFREKFGVTPKAYLRAVRLNRVRADLVMAPPKVIIADVANRWGFWHMGQFAADYRRQFGELPSDTRRREIGRETIQSRTA